MSGKYAIIIGNTEYNDPGLAQLTAPGKDAEDFAHVLKAQSICAFDKVYSLINKDILTINQAIEDFFTRKKPDDLLLLYFSGHGVRDENGSLYLAVKNTNRNRLRSTAVRSDFIREAMDQSRSKRQVLILDCCNSGAFARGTKSATGGTMGTATAFEGKGFGHIVLTATDAIQFAWEGDKIINSSATNSLFTHFLVKGLEGEADQDGDGKITVDELYDYAYEKIINTTSKQTPGKWSYSQQGEIVLRQSTEIKPQPLPPELVNAIESPLPLVREGAVRQLEELLKGSNTRLAQSAHQALERIALEDDSTRVKIAVQQALQSAVKPVQEVKEIDHIPKRETPKPKQKSTGITWLSPAIIGGSIVLLSIFVIVSSTVLAPSFLPSLSGRPTTQTDFLIPRTSNNITETATLASTSEPSPAMPTVGMRTVPTAPGIPTSTLSLIPEENCSNSPKMLSIGTVAQIITAPLARDYLILRSEATQDSVDFGHFKYLDKVTVMDGPICNTYHPHNDVNKIEYFWWWKVKEEKSLSVSPESEGWIVEGSDSIDKIFVLPTNSKDGAALIHILPGEFIMGMKEEQARQLCPGDSCDKAYTASQPEHKVTLTYGYWIYRTEVSNAQYAECVKSNVCGPPGDGSPESQVNNYYGLDGFYNYPVVWVNWNQAQTYCNWAEKKGRLPTSAEWEYAARGDDKRLFPWGDDFSSLHQANVNNPSGRTQPVDEYSASASPFGLLNMTGNVWEWVSDWFSVDYYKNNTNWTNPTGPSNGTEKVGRGGSYEHLIAISSVAIQDWYNPDQSGYGVGFRCVIEEP